MNDRPYGNQHPLSRAPESGRERLPVRRDGEAGGIHQPVLYKPPVRKRIRLGVPAQVARPISWLFRTLAILVFLAAVGIGVGYFRLQHGPVSMTFLAKPIEESLNREFAGMKVAVRDAVLRLSERGGVEFRLTNVVLRDADDVPIALAPLAAIEISGLALMRGQLAPSRIDLIGSRMLLLQGEDGALSLRFSKEAELLANNGGVAQPVSPVLPGAGGKAAQAPSTAPAGSSPSGAPNGVAPSNDLTATSRGRPLVLGRIDLAKALADAAARARERVHVTSFLKSLGLRDSILIFDRGGKRNFWLVPDFDIDFRHAKESSVISSKAVIEAASGPWTIALRSEDSQATKSIVLNGELDNLIPMSLARAMPQWVMLNAFDVPVSGRTRVELRTDGELSGALIRMRLGSGKLRLPWQPGTAIPITSGDLSLRYDNSSRTLEIAPSKLQFGEGYAVVQGKVEPAERQNGREVWKFDLQVVEGQIIGQLAEATKLPIRSAMVTGWITPEIGRVQLGQFYLNVNGSEIAMAADMVGLGSTPRAKLQGRIGAMPLSTFERLWPTTLAPETRRLVMKRVKRGQIASGTFRLEIDDQTAAAGTARQPIVPKIEFSVTATDLELLTAGGKGLLEAKRGLLQMKDGNLEVSMPQAQLRPKGGKAIKLSALRFGAGNILNDAPTGELEFNTRGRVRDAFLASQQFGLAPPYLKNIIAGKVGGTFKGKVTLRGPLGEDADASDWRAEGRIKIRSGSLTANPPEMPFKVSGVSLDIDMARRAINVSGKMLLNGVPAKLNWQRIHGEPLERQPPLTIAATLDDTDRAQLGIDLRHLMTGSVDVKISVRPQVGSDPAAPGASVKTQVVADLTNAELMLHSLAWRKPPGSRAILEFDLAKGTKYPTELQQLRLVGSDIAIDGWAGLDKDMEVREFVFPDFSLHVISRLNIRGSLSDANVWRIKARGSTFDGRSYLSALYDLNDKRARLKIPGRKVPGIDLTAEIDNVIGHGEVSLRGFKLTMKERNDALLSLRASGKLDGKQLLTLKLQERKKKGRKRILFADAGNAGLAFKLIGLYKNIRKGRANLKVNLDGKGTAETTGQLEVRKFQILGDQVVSEVLQNVDPGRPPPPPRGGKRGRRGKRLIREKFKFDSMSVPFKIGKGQLVLENSSIKGPLIGASMRGRIDFKAKKIKLGGTYVPLSGLNSAFCKIPIVGPILTGPRCEGVFGITFAIKGKMSDPEVIVNPLSALTPGIFRELMSLTTHNPKIKDRGEGRRRKSRPPRRGRRGRRPPGRRGEPPPPSEVLGGWSAEATRGGVKRR